MKINILYYLIILLMVTSCVKYNGDIPKEYKKLIGAYKLNDTFYFKSNLNDLDTIKVVKLDSLQMKNQGPSSLPHKQINLEILHLPFNKWNSGIDETNPNKIINECLVTIFKQQTNRHPEDDDFGIYINYRDFFGELDMEKLRFKKKDTIKADTTEYLPKKLIEDTVIEIYWSLDKGMIGYKKKDGQVYNLVD